MVRLAPHMLRWTTMALAAMVLYLSAPGRADAHISPEHTGVTAIAPAALTPGLVNDPATEADAEDESHCHGSLECFVTLFVPDAGRATSTRDAHVTRFTPETTAFIGTVLGRDPPVPIAFV